MNENADLDDFDELFHFEEKRAKRRRKTADKLFFISVCCVTAIATFLATYVVCKANWQYEAVKAGHAEWKSDETGRPVLSWK